MKTKEQIAAEKKAYRLANPEKVAKWRKTFNEKHPGRSTELSMQSYYRRKEKDPEKVAESFRRHYDKDAAIARSKKWKKANPDRVCELTMRRNARKKKATPKWANQFFINEAYHLAKLRTKATGFKWEVDHIFPLNSDIVCGLHVENNLQVIPAVMNNKKGNKLMEVSL